MYKSMFQRWLEATSKTADYMLQYQFQKEMMKQNLLSDREIDVIADRVIQRLNISVDASDIINAIDDLNNRIKNLGNY